MSLCVTAVFLWFPYFWSRMRLFGRLQLNLSLRNQINSIILLHIEMSGTRKINYRICLYFCEKFGVTVLYKVWSVGRETTYGRLWVGWSSHSELNRQGTVFRGQGCESTGQSSHLQHSHSILLQILEKILVHVIQQ
jgi:hypothetical protein